MVFAIVGPGESHPGRAALDPDAVQRAVFAKPVKKAMSCTTISLVIAWLQCDTHHREEVYDSLEVDSTTPSFGTLTNLFADEELECVEVTDQDQDDLLKTTPGGSVLLMDCTVPVTQEDNSLAYFLLRDLHVFPFHLYYGVQKITADYDEEEAMTLRRKARKDISMRKLYSQFSIWAEKNVHKRNGWHVICFPGTSNRKVGGAARRKKYPAKQKPPRERFPIE